MKWKIILGTYTIICRAIKLSLKVNIMQIIAKYLIKKDKVFDKFLLLV